MDEQERAEQFSADVDRLLAGDKSVSPGSDDPTMLDMAQQLAQADFSAQSRGRERLRARLLNREIITKEELIMNQQQRLLRRLALVAAVLVILIVTMLAVPPLRAVAQDILARIGLLTITDDPTDAELFMQGEPPRDYTTPGTPAPSATPDASIPVYLPAYVPAGYTFDEVNSVKDDREYTKIVPLPNDDLGNIVNYQLNIQQFPKTQAVGAGTFAVGDAAEVTDVTVGGNKGVWIEHSLMGMQAGRDGQPIPLYVNYLIWETDTVFFMIRNLVMSPAEPIALENQPEPLLSLEEMLRVAGSLQPAQP